jgi:hypothetical protein
MPPGRPKPTPCPDPAYVAGVGAAAKVANVHRRTIYRWMDEGHLSGQRGLNDVYYWHPEWGQGPFFCVETLLFLAQKAERSRKAMRDRLPVGRMDNRMTFGGERRPEPKPKGEKRHSTRPKPYTIAEEKERFHWPADVPLRPDEHPPTVPEDLGEIVLPWEESPGVPKAGYKADGKRIGGGSKLPKTR